MAAVAEKQSISGYFRKLFEDNPELLKLRNNDEILARWKKDHEVETVPMPVKQGLANVKSILRGKDGAGATKSKKSKKPAKPDPEPSQTVNGHQGFNRINQEVKDIPANIPWLHEHGWRQVESRLDGVLLSMRVEGLSDSLIYETIRDARNSVIDEQTCDQAVSGLECHQSRRA